MAEVHTHQPSEHTIEGGRFDMEAHLVHVGGGGENAVVGLLYRLGRANGPLGRLIDEWPPPEFGTARAFRTTSRTPPRCFGAGGQEA